ncbi:MAG TPA: hypothetical protein VFD32_14705 [Dehalococcoidia bacterium]|nr:hypothetical protein [Dehalococcoidia bacterium]
MFKRRRVEDDGPQRGPGGGRVRRRPLRKERRRRQQSLADTLFVSTLFAIIVFFVELFGFKAPLAICVFEAIVVLIGGTFISIYTRRWFGRREARQQKSKR